MTLKDDIEAVREDPEGLENLYRTTRTEGKEATFLSALQQTVLEHPGELLLRAWAHRLDVPLIADREDQKRWWVIVTASVVLGVVTAVLAGNGPPVPVPGEATTLFWVGFGPAIAMGLLAYLAWVQRTEAHGARYVAAATTILVAAVYVGVTLGGRTDDAAMLAALHLPFVCWAAVGAALCLGYARPDRQTFAYLTKSVESVLTGGIFFGAGLIFVGLTFGIFAVLGIELPEDDLRVVAAWGVGAIPLLAIGSVYDASAAPESQDWQAGLTRTLRILARLLLPLALGVLLVYVLWFIPAYFRKPFEEREVLIVYNATILAIMVLLAVVVSGPIDVGSLRQSSLFKYAVLGLGLLTLILNAYALAAVVSRSLESGWTPNRFAVIGWNITTLIILASVGRRLWAERERQWTTVFREALGRAAPLAAIWAVALLIVLPFLGS